MTQDEKAEKYEQLTREGDVVQREISRLQSMNAGVNTTSPEYDSKMNILNNRMSILEEEMRQLYTI